MSSPSSCLGVGCGERGFSAGHNVIVDNQLGKSKNGLCAQVKEEGNRLSDTEHEQHGSCISERAATGHLRVGSESSDDDDEKDESQCSADGGDGDADDQSSKGSPQAQNIPKNVKLPQSKLLTCNVVDGLHLNLINNPVFTHALSPHTPKYMCNVNGRIIVLYLSTGLYTEEYRFIHNHIQCQGLLV